MNIFALDNNPVTAAQYMADIHVRSKMLLEASQILSNCYHLDTLERAPKTQKGTVRKYSYPHHGCCKWAQKTRGNFIWLCVHGLSLGNERMKRWPHSKRHFSTDFLTWCLKNTPDKLESQSTEVTPFYQAFGKENQHLISPDPIFGYRLYYKYVKQNKLKLTWTNRERPDWMLDNTLVGAINEQRCFCCVPEIY